MCSSCARRCSAVSKNTSSLSCNVNGSGTTHSEIPVLAIAPNPPHRVRPHFARCAKECENAASDSRIALGPKCRLAKSIRLTNYRQPCRRSGRESTPLWNRRRHRATRANRPRATLPTTSGGNGRRGGTERNERACRGRAVRASRQQNASLSFQPQQHRRRNRKRQGSRQNTGLDL